MLILFMISCTKESVLFEKEVWWYGHWENMEVQNQYFSSGWLRSSRSQFFFSTLDTVTDHIFLKTLVDYSYKNKWKIIELEGGQFVKINQIEEESLIELFGPAESIEDLGENGVIYRNIKFEHPLIPDSVLYMR